ncbi:hydrophobic surface binding protein [Mycena rebaudengoi]|nr:hydrophobic surface binding protein [Mycena rebaudengoi]
MVQLTCAVSLLALFAAASLSTPLKRSIEQVEADIALTGKQLEEYDIAISAFPASGVAGVQRIHAVAQALDSTIDATRTEVVNTGLFDDVDGSVIFGGIESFVPTIQDILSQLVAKKADFDAAGGSAVVLQDLITLKASSVAFGDALIANSPDDLKPTATAINDGILAGLGGAIAVYEA